MLNVVASLKGGSGKSTVSFNLAIWLAMAGREVRLYDLDPQATLTDVVEVREDEGFSPSLTIHQGVKELDQCVGESEFDTLVDVGVADLKKMRKALSLADRILVPVTPSQADVWSTQRFLKDFVTDPETPVVGFINRGDTHHAVRETDEAAAALVTLPGLQFIKQRLHQRTVYRRSFSEGLAVFELETRGKAAQEFTALAASLFPEVLK